MLRAQLYPPCLTAGSHFHYRRGGRVDLASTAALILALAIAPHAQADEPRSSCRSLLTVAGGVQYGLLGLGGEYGGGHFAGYVGGGIFGGTGGVRFLFGDRIGGFVSLGAGVLATPDDPGTNVYFIPLDVIGGLRLRWGVVAFQVGIGAGLWWQLSSGPYSKVRSGLIPFPDVQLGVSYVFP